MSDTKYASNIPWSVLQKHLQRTIRALYAELEKATETAEVYRLQGEIRRLKKLLNLPGTLEVLDEESEDTK